LYQEIRTSKHPQKFQKPIIKKKTESDKSWKKSKNNYPKNPNEFNYPKEKPNPKTGLILLSQRELSIPIKIGPLSEKPMTHKRMCLL